MPKYILILLAVVMTCISLGIVWKIQDYQDQVIIEKKLLPEDLQNSMAHLPELPSPMSFSAPSGI